MELYKDISFLPRPIINPNDLEYIISSKKVYVNLFEIRMKKKLTIFQYPYTVSPPIGPEDLLIRNKLFKYSNKKFKDIFGDYFISGDSLYSMKEKNQNFSIKSYLYLNGRKEYII